MKPPAPRPPKNLRRKKLGLKEIDTGSSKQGNIEHFFTKPG
jgi:hypothetical protein